MPEATDLSRIEQILTATINGEEITIVPQSRIEVLLEVLCQAILAGSGSSTGGGGATDHRNLTHRDATGQHPMSAITGLAAALGAVTEKIPSVATAQNQLADKNFVNSSISTNAAYYISNNGEPFTSVAALEAYSGTVTNNDYATVTGMDADGNTYYDRYKATVVEDVVTWAKEQRMNNSSFTSAQWATINSGFTAADKAILAAVADDYTRACELMGLSGGEADE